MQSKFGRFRDVLWSLVTLATAAGVPRVLIVDELRRLAGLVSDNEDTYCHGGKQVRLTDCLLRQVDSAEAYTKNPVDFAAQKPA
jgi:hypothetical protein